MSEPCHLLAIGAHPDDVELTCGGTLVKAARQGYRTAIVDMTGGETGTHGSQSVRASEADAAASVLGATIRLNAGLPDAGLHNTDETRRVVVELIRRIRPLVVVLPYPIGRHPDHRIASELCRDASYLAGLANYPAAGEAHRPEKILYTLAYREDAVKPAFVVDISDEFETKLEAIRCYGSQFDGRMAAGEIFPAGGDVYENVRMHCARYGSLIRVAYGEPYLTHETVRIDDVVAMGVRSM
ncbi:MAG: bacillithiol biosynthesis deacetylase BshB1 [Gemmatimonadota bacterium]|nr:bacillithiol biosynthesis deacetylase BshB1 [Gemmatimonadota bacterium]MDH3369305.1 bacillithiol biosynthesis deacetylase BshB1 [Gemmatimonadota bacterium]MDH3477318.1 bacillithiol biosynthesis deacetylase BshB1 [Gemmatimonadota bacterium]MDH5550460.1 bacillithiol biosynthesis deacetylase BshB1 [Gemmatimonadota bacterium]